MSDANIPNVPGVQPEAVVAPAPSIAKPDFMNQEQWDALPPQLKLGVENPGLAEQLYPNKGLFSHISEFMSGVGQAGTEKKAAQARAAGVPDALMQQSGLTGAPQTANALPAASGSGEQDFKVPNTPAGLNTPAPGLNTQLNPMSTPESEMIRSMQAESKVAKQMADAQAKEVELSAEIIKKQQTAAEQAELDIRERWTNTERMVSQQLTQLNDLRSNFLDEKYEPGKIDPQRANPFASDSVSRQLMAGIAVGLGGFAAGKLGGSNSALDIINKTIDRDIEAQRSNIAQKQKAFELGLEGKLRAGQMNMDIISGLDKQFGSSLLAEDAYKVLRLEQTSAALDHMGAKNAAILKSGPFQILKHQIDQKIAAGKMQFANNARDNALRVALGSAMDKNEEISPSILAVMPKEMREAHLDAQKRLVAIVGERATDEKAKQRFNENAVPLIQSRDNIKEVMRMSKGMNKFTDFKDRALIKARLTPIVGSLRQAYTGPGILTDSEKIAILDSVGDPTKITDVLGVEPAKLEQTIEMIDNTLKRYAQETFSNPARAIRSLNSSLKERSGRTKDK